MHQATFKLLSLKLYRHPYLGNLELKFVDECGRLNGQYTDTLLEMSLNP